MARKSLNCVCVFAFLQTWFELPFPRWAQVRCAQGKPPLSLDWREVCHRFGLGLFVCSQCRAVLSLPSSWFVCLSCRKQAQLVVNLGVCSQVAIFLHIRTFWLWTTEEAAAPESKNLAGTAQWSCTRIKPQQQEPQASGLELGTRGWQILGFAALLGWQPANSFGKGFSSLLGTLWHFTGLFYLCFNPYPYTKTFSVVHCNTMILLCGSPTHLYVCHVFLLLYIGVGFPVISIFMELSNSSANWTRQLNCNSMCFPLQE